MIAALAVAAADVPASQAEPIREEHKVYTETNPATRIVTVEDWIKDNDHDRPDGPAIINRDAKTGTVTREVWCKDGKRDRTDGPAVVERDPDTKAITLDRWFNHGVEFIPSEQVRVSWLSRSGETLAADNLAKAAPAPQP